MRHYTLYILSTPLLPYFVYNSWCGIYKFDNVYLTIAPWINTGGNKRHFSQFRVLRKVCGSAGANCGST